MKQIRRGTFLGFFTCFVAAALCSASAESDSHKAHKTEGCKEVMQERQKMMSEMKAQNAQLQGLVSQLNQASEQKKVDLLAQIVTQMVQQRAQQSEKMEAMHSRMMQHMSQHMQQGEHSLAHCPMLQSMEGMGGSDTENGKESEHHSSGSDSK